VESVKSKNAKKQPKNAHGMVKSAIASRSKIQNPKTLGAGNARWKHVSLYPMSANGRAINVLLS
jgi:hypothetical protein